MTHYFKIEIYLFKTLYNFKKSIDKIENQYQLIKDAKIADNTFRQVNII